MNATITATQRLWGICVSLFLLCCFRAEAQQCEIYLVHPESDTLVQNESDKNSVIPKGYHRIQKPTLANAKPRFVIVAKAAFDKPLKVIKFSQTLTIPSPTGEDLGYDLTFDSKSLATLQKLRKHKNSTQYLLCFEGIPLQIFEIETLHEKTATLNVTVRTEEARVALEKAMKAAESK
jgi:hypothetical protein